MGTLQVVLHGLAYFGVWLLNVLIYETIALVIWFPVAYGADQCPKMTKHKADEVARITMIVLLILWSIAAIACIFGWLRIVPMPVFD